MKNIEKEFKSIEQIKSEIETNLNKNIVITEHNKQGKLIKEFSGEIINAYNSLFIVKIKLGKNFLNKSFSYVDFLINELNFSIVK